MKFRCAWTFVKGLNSSEVLILYEYVFNEIDPLDLSPFHRFADGSLFASG